MHTSIHYLEMRLPSALKPASRAWSDTGLNLIEVRQPQGRFNRMLYQWVGHDYQWVDRLSWSVETWQRLVENPAMRTWVAYSDGAIAGYFELYRQADDVEIQYFGLTPEFTGQGLGGPLLQRCIETAWHWAGTKRVWLHTCSKDHPAALPNYVARGFEQYRVEHTVQGATGC
ncbi:MAG: GNAT family N-acetyltransferase [Oleiphilaceae bacterium]|nr:GNAT family N-acetyltransferase [Oleiphilaceae bacterium]